MSAHDREVLDLLRDEPELLAIADAVADTQQKPRPFRPVRAVGAVALAVVAIFVLVLAAPWDRGGGGRGGVLERALAAIEARGPVVHLTTKVELTHGQQTLPALVTESYYDKRRHLVHVVTRSKEGTVLADYTTSAIDDEFATFPGLLDQADFYRKALASGQAKVVGNGKWHGRSVYWVELNRGGAFILRVGIDRMSYRPVVFRTLNPDGTFSGFQLAVLGFGYVSARVAGFETDAPILVTGRVVGPDCRPVKARVSLSLSPEDTGRLIPETAVAATRPDGTFTLRADPTKSPFREALARNTWLNFDVTALSGAGAKVNMAGFYGISRFVKGGRWLDGEPEQPEQPAPIRIDLIKKSQPGRLCK